MKFSAALHTILSRRLSNNEGDRVIMGTILSCQCHGCGYTEKLFVGGGMSDCDPKTALRAVPDDPALAAALRKGAGFQIDRDAAACQKCRRLFAAPYVTYWPPDGGSRQTAAVCPVCRRLLTRYDYQKSKIPCPSCGGTMDLLPRGHWD